VVRDLGSFAAVVLEPLGVTRVETRLPPLSGPDPIRRAQSTPVVLLHGYGGNPANWRPMRRNLAAAGFGHVRSMSYNPLAHDIPALAVMLVRECAEAMDTANADRVHVVAHSLGGVVLRYAVQCFGLPAGLDTAVTIAAPHAGTPVARLGRGAVAVALRPSSALLAEMEATAGARPAGRVRWVTYYSDADLVVPASSARLSHPALGARNVLVRNEGHMSILSAAAVLHGTVRDLLESEAAAAGVAA